MLPGTCWRNSVTDSARASVEEIFNSIGSQVKRYLVSRVRNEALADDLLQEVFLRIHKNIDSLKDINGIQSWIYRIAKNVAVDHHRASKGYPDELTEDLLIATPGLSAPGSGGELDLSVKRMIEQLPEPYREALLLTTYSGLKQHELASRAGISLPAAKSRVQRGRKLLKEMLLDCCHFEFDRYGTLLNYEAKRKCCEQQIHTIRPKLS
jgi:RNA polymerase sigma-70 factor (ECF subfamily)